MEDTDRADEVGSKFEVDDAEKEWPYPSVVAYDFSKNVPGLTKMLEYIRFRACSQYRSGHQRLAQAHVGSLPVIPLHYHRQPLSSDMFN